MRANPGRALAASAALGTALLGCADLVVRTEAPPLAAGFPGRGIDRLPGREPERWLGVALLPAAPGLGDADVPDLAERAALALRNAGLAVVELASDDGPAHDPALLARAAEHGADGAVFVRLTLREEVRTFHPLPYLLTTATFGLLPLTVASDRRDYALELLAVRVRTREALAEAAAARGVSEPHTLWQLAEGELLGWDVGEALGGAKRRKRALEAALAAELLAEAAPALAAALRPDAPPSPAAAGPVR
jgi:hypothetical protein